MFFSLFWPKIISICMVPMADESLPKATRLSKKPEISPVKLIFPNLLTASGRWMGFSLKLFASRRIPSLVTYILLTCPKI